jgi:hypothetical protein
LNFYAYSGDGQDDKVWDKVGQAIGNLRALKKLSVYACIEDPDLPKVTPNWEILVRILSQVQQKIEVKIAGFRPWNTVEASFFVRAIHGHSAITSFVDGGDGGGEYYFPCECLGALTPCTRHWQHYPLWNRLTYD